MARVAFLFFDKFKFVSGIEDLEALAKLQALSAHDKSANKLRIKRVKNKEQVLFLQHPEIIPTNM